MNILHRMNRLRPTLLLLISCLPAILRAQPAPPGSGGSIFPTNLDSWSFEYTTTNTLQSDKGYYPVSFTNITLSSMGNISGSFSMMLDSTNAAWLQYRVVETNG